MGKVYVKQFFYLYPPKKIGMEPLMSYDGFIMLQDDRKSRDLLNDYFREQGYTVATPERDNKDKNKNKPENLQNHLEDKE